MLKNYLTIAFRNPLRHKTFSLLTILGLSTGIAACFILTQYSLFEMSYDDFHKNAKSIYRLGLSVYDDGKLQTQVPKNFSALGPALKNDFPEVKDYTRVFPIDGTMAVKRNNIVFNEKDILFTDASMLQVFSFPVVRGELINALKEPYSVVLTESTAKKYFKNEDPIGQQLTIQEGRIDVPLTVTAIVKDVPENSHLTFDFLVSHATLDILWGERASNSWGEALFFTYIQVDEGADGEQLKNKLTPALMERYSNWRPPLTLDFVIQPLRDIYLYSDMVQEARVNGSGRQVSFLWIIAALIVVLAWINYINLSTARAMERAKEVGIRKVVGANKLQLMQQFIFESLLLNLFSIVFAVCIVQSTLPFLNSFTGKTIPITTNSYWLIGLFLFFIIGSIVSAVVPSLILTAFKTVNVLKGKLTSSVKGLVLRKSFVVFQFASSIALLGGTFIVFLQLDFIRSKDLGADISQTIVLPNPDIIDSTMQSRIEFFKNELLKHREISYAVSSTSIPGKPDNIIQGGLSRLEKSDENGVNHYNFGIDRHFIEAYKIKVISGRNFSSIADERSVLINKTAMHVLGYEKPDDAIGQKVTANWAPERTIIGVVEDFHQQSLRSAYDPIVFSLDDTGEWGYYSIKLSLTSNGKSVSDLIAVVNDTWTKSFPGNPFEYFFLDDYFNEQYKDDLRFGKVLNVFSILTLFVACLGILGLSIFSASQRTKEIGVRKVLGASASNILLLLSGDYAKMILIALSIAVPFTYYFVAQWLDGFAYHITVQWWMLIIPGILVFIIALLAVSSQSVKAALTNPTKSLNS